MSSTTSSFLSGVFDFFGSAATKLLTLTAGVETSIHSLQSSDPLVGQAINLAEQEAGSVPVVGQAEAIANSVLGFAQLIAGMTTQAAAKTGNASAASVTADAVSSPGTITG